MVDELAGGVVRAIGAVLRFLLETLRDALVELIQHLIGRIFVGFLEMIRRLLRLTVRSLDLLYRAIFRPAGPVDDRSAVLHAAAICILMMIGFGIGATASTFYQADWSASDVVASTSVER